MKYGINADALIAELNSATPPVVLDCRFDLLQPTYAKDAYDKAHIPGAFFLDVEHDLSREKSRYGGNHPFQVPEVLKERLEDVGISNDRPVVVYDDGDLTGPTRFLYQALQMGLENVRVLNGGLPAYVHAGGETTDAPSEKPAQPGHIVMALRPDMLVDMDTVRASLDDPDTILIDSRARARYLGQTEPVYPIAGHIPGAWNYYCGDVFEDGLLKDDAALKEHFAALDPTKRIILSCGSGVSACINGFALMQIGIPHVLYNGSYSEWIQFPENEVRTEDENPSEHSTQA